MHIMERTHRADLKGTYGCRPCIQAFFAEDMKSTHLATLYNQDLEACSARLHYWITKP